MDQSAHRQCFGDSRRQPGVYDHGKHGLSGKRCSGGWDIGWSSEFLYFLQCYSRSYHRGQLCGQNLCHRRFRRDKWVNQPLGQCFSDARRQPGIYDHAEHGLSGKRCSVDGTSVGAVTSYTFSNVTAAHTRISASLSAKLRHIARWTMPRASVMPRRQPGVYDHGQYRLSGKRCPGGWNIGWSSDFIYFLQCYSRSYHSGQLCGQNLCHCSFRRDKWVISPSGSVS